MILTWQQIPSPLVSEIIVAGTEKYDVSILDACPRGFEFPMGKMKEGYDSIVSCTKLNTRLWRREKYGLCPVNHNPLKLEQTQDLAPFYEENSAFYMLRSNIMRNSDNRIGRNPFFMRFGFQKI
jgi:hypothetical protein